ncbi:MAG: PTS sugar transporter subunit IIA [Cetobacterium somerae]|uniref:PTS sugar transporter subunit IIA n=1 Tax=Cetobacterium TaxID=180162 RepID=UPI001F070C9A|nr:MULTISPECIES: PTS sugar transporter subunit IIA [Cetobacterium]UPO97456.1 PTS sugar transporter subunit IIA [Cetobacterium somerae]WVJ00665.1 PTS sugar transporter subunit IIA [Cetobacterium somerae]
MIKELLESNIQILPQVDSWEEAIKIASRPLLEKGYIEPRYIDTMISKVNELGFYIVLSEDVAMPHSRPEDGVLKMGMSLLKLDTPAKFGNNNIQIVITLAAKDNESHIDALTNLVELLNDDEKIEKIKLAKTNQEILEII